MRNGQREEMVHAASAFLFKYVNLVAIRSHEGIFVAGKRDVVTRAGRCYNTAAITIAGGISSKSTHFILSPFIPSCPHGKVMPPKQRRTSF